MTECSNNNGANYKKLTSFIGCTINSVELIECTPQHSSCTGQHIFIKLQRPDGTITGFSMAHRQNIDDVFNYLSYEDSMRLYTIERTRYQHICDWCGEDPQSFNPPYKHVHDGQDTFVLCNGCYNSKCACDCCGQTTLARELQSSDTGLMCKACNGLPT